MEALKGNLLLMGKFKSSIRKNFVKTLKQKFNARQFLKSIKY